MSFKVEATPNFKREAKRIAKKYRSLKEDLSSLITQLEENPESGTPLGNNVFKIRINIASKGKGSSGGGRVITYFKSATSTVYLLSIYNKGEKDNISDSEIKLLLREK